MVTLPQESLNEFLHFVELPLLAFRRRGRPQRFPFRQHRLRIHFHPERLRKCGNRLGASRRSLPFRPADDQSDLRRLAKPLVVGGRALMFRLHGWKRARFDTTRSRRFSSPFAVGRPIEPIDPAGLDDQPSGRHHSGEFGVAKFGQQTRDVAGDWFAPESFAFIEVARHEGRINPLIESRGIQRQQSAFPDTDHAHGQFRVESINH